MSEPTPAPVIFEHLPGKDGALLVCTLNSEATLNALTQEMIDTLSAKLFDAAADSRVKAVWLQGAGQKAFCAGGDIRKIYQAMIETKPGELAPSAAHFFKSEYKLDHQIHTYPKPLFVWGHGIVMGGGLGLMAGGRYRIVTEKTRLAMPEVTIGLYPDVGASYFLNRINERMKKPLGLFLGLTGARLGAADCMVVGMADIFMESLHKDALMKDLLANSVNAFHDVLAHFAQLSEPKLEISQIEKSLPAIEETLKASSMMQLWQNFEKLATDDPWVQTARDTLLKGSPTSAAVIFSQLERAKNLSLAECFEMERKMSCQFATHHDFREGIRALIIDKDNKPQWKPARLQDVTPELIEEHFQDLQGQESKD